MQQQAPKYKRVLLKLSGEVLMGKQSVGLDACVAKRIIQEIKTVSEAGIQLCIVVGGGNFFRGIKGVDLGLNQVTSDQMGMLATTMNALALQNMLEKSGVPSHVQSAVTISGVCDIFHHRTACQYLQNQAVIIFAAGLGHPYFTTDSAAVLRAIEMQCDLLLKGTKVNGVYTSDPAININAKRYDFLDYDTVLQEKLGVMDMTAITLAKEHKLAIGVFSIVEHNNLVNILLKNQSFTCIHESSHPHMIS